MGKETYQDQIATNQSMASSFQTSPVSTRNFDKACIRIDVTGSPVGNVAVQVCNNYNPNDPNIIPIWDDLPLGLNPLTGSPYSYAIDITETSWPFMRLNYVATSGTGTMNAVIFTKDI